ncbi:MAG TPA: hypothetical protein VMS00_02905, partial [Acidimicrobiales bacterium]|nr:hypothetical protein [Acidimicrobiales bacterium]
MPSLPLSPDRLAWWSTRLADPPEPTELPSGRARPAVLSPARTERRAPAPAFPGEGARAQDMA